MNSPISRTPIHWVTYSGRDLNAFGRKNWVRYGLGKGLEYQKTLGVNPYHYGIVGGTDSHNGLMANVAEDNFMAGSHGAADGTVALRRDGEVGGWLKGPDLNPGSITGVWAPQNTREAIYDAMYNRETFATSGPRIKVRFFGQFGAAPATGDFNNHDRAGLRQRRADGRHAQGRQRRAGVYRLGREGAARRSTAISTASRSSRAPWMPPASRRIPCSMWRGPASASPMQTASCRRSAIPST